MPEVATSETDIRAQLASILAREDAAEIQDAAQDEILPETGEAGATLPTSKTSEFKEVESTDAPESAVETIDPPNSWPAQDKELFRSLPPEAQRVVQAREKERDDFLSQRSFEIAAERRRIAEAEQQAIITQQRLAAELNQISELATVVLPAQFSDIKTQADYLRVKSEDPARAAQYDAFHGMVQQLQQQRVALGEQQIQRHLDNEAMLLAEKYPEFRDPYKGKEIVDSVRKAAVDYYGFQPTEVERIMDHRYVLILRDALAWQQHQQGLKSVEKARVTPTLKQALKPTAQSDNGQSAARRALLNQAKAATSERERARALAQLV